MQWRAIYGGMAGFEFVFSLEKYFLGFCRVVMVELIAKRVYYSTKAESRTRSIWWGVCKIWIEGSGVGLGPCRAFRGHFEESGLGLTALSRGNNTSVKVDL